LLITFYEENVCSKEIKCIFASVINQKHNQMTKSQAESLKESIERWNRVNAKVTLIGETEDGKIICELETSTYRHIFLIGKRGSYTCKNKYLKFN
jgi:hypothetical protein